MADQRAGGIAWTDKTWNPIRGCSRISAGCMQCYAERQAGRFINGAYRDLVKRVVVDSATGATEARWTGKVELVEEALTLPFRWRTPRRVFVNSMSDLFHEAVPDEWIDAIFAVILRAHVERGHTFQVLTKRPERMRAWAEGVSAHYDAGELGDRWDAAAASHIEACSIVPDLDTPWWPVPAVWLGVSVEDQATADERIPLLLQTPAAVRWASYEPAIGPVDFRLFLDRGAAVETRGLDWIVVGGESGPGARPLPLNAVAAIADGCRIVGVPVYVKQDSGPRPGQQGRIPGELWALKEFPGELDEQA